MMTCPLVLSTSSEIINPSCSGQRFTIEGVAVNNDLEERWEKSDTELDYCIKKQGWTRRRK
jgi:hypothetical protein